MSEAKAIEVHDVPKAEESSPRVRATPKVTYVCVSESPGDNTELLHLLAAMLRKVGNEP